MANVQHSIQVLNQYRKFVRLLRWWPEQREDESALKSRALIKVQKEYKINKHLQNPEEIENKMQHAKEEYKIFVNIGSNRYREAVCKHIHPIIKNQYNTNQISV